MDRKLPIGIQSFEKMRRDDFVYVDKTAYVWALARASVPVFLSRPRRFGKSLLVSTMRAYFEGRHELFGAWRSSGWRRMPRRARAASRGSRGRCSTWTSRGRPTRP